MPAFRIAAAALAALILSPLAQAQYGQPIGRPLDAGPVMPWGQPAYGGPVTGGGQGVVCESRDGGFRECGTPFSGPPAIVRTLSASGCVQGQTWGSRAPGSVWVTAGCRAEFVDGYAAQGGYPGHYGGAYADGQLLRCESDQGRQRECRAPVRTRLTLVRQLSDAPCVEGQTWGSQRSGRVWVRGGCRGDFAPQGARPGGPAYDQPSYGYGAGQTITCESLDRRSNACGWDARWGHPVLVETLSADACLEGRTWGYDGRQIWVDGGCRARFGSR